MGEENWPDNVVRSKSVGDIDRSLCWGNEEDVDLGNIVADGPRLLVCADCGAPQTGPVIHMKPETYTLVYRGEPFYLEKHIGVACGCAAKRGLLSRP